MLAIWVKVRVKPELRKRFLEAIEVDALGSERDEPGCLRFNVLQDEHDENVYYFYEVYKDQAALEAHRAMPHYAVWRAAADTLDGPTEATRCDSVFPGPASYWENKSAPAALTHNLQRFYQRGSGESRDLPIRRLSGCMVGPGFRRGCEFPRNDAADTADLDG